MNPSFKIEMITKLSKKLLQKSLNEEIEPNLNLKKDTIKKVKPYLKRNYY